MGCHQSKVEEQVEAPATTDLVVHNSDAPVANKEPEAAKTETPEATTAEEKAAEVEVPTVEVPTVEAPVEEEKAPAPPASAEKPAEPAPTETQEAAKSAEEAPVSEKPAEQDAAPAAEPEAETVEESDATVSFQFQSLTYGERRVVFYEFKLVDKNDSAKNVTIKKRYNDFKTLHDQVAKLMANENNVPASQGDKFQTYPALPPLPRAGMTTMILGRRNKGLTDEREAQFTKILNAIVRHPIASESDAFKGFLA